MVNKAILKKPWRSPRGKVYPPNTTFKLIKRDTETSRSIYEFAAPGLGHGWVVFSDQIFKALTEEEKHIREIRREMLEDHIKKTKSRFL